MASQTLVLPWLLEILCLMILFGTSTTTSTSASPEAQPEPPEAQPEPEPPRAFFVFGDSLVDNGNNNFLATIARADSPPYGVDHPTHRATGRFSNGLNIADIISEKMGSETTLPCLSPLLQGDKLLIGANFASAGVGILNDTGLQFVNIIRMFRQLQYFKEYQTKLRDFIGAARAKQLVNKALVLISVGGNDFINNYYLIPGNPRSIAYSVPQYVDLLIYEYKKILTRLYDLGARRVLVTGTGPMGCAPAEVALRGSGGECAMMLQDAANLYNPKLSAMLSELNTKYGSDIFIGVNIDVMQDDFISDPKKYGFATARMACCGQGPFNGIGLCRPRSFLCENRDSFVFWDQYHPTERANRIIVEKIILGSNKYMVPANLSSIMVQDTNYYMV